MDSDEGQLALLVDDAKKRDPAAASDGPGRPRASRA